MAKDAGADSVKFQKEIIKNFILKSFLILSMINRNSYGETYGQHRDALEFDKQQFLEIKDYSKMLGIKFFATPFDFDSIDFLDDLDVPALKIASADLLNTPLQIEIAKENKKIYFEHRSWYIRRC